MKQYTTPEQTAKLIELGFKKPKSIIDVWAHETDIDMEYEYEFAYSIGELIEMLPQYLDYKVGVADMPIDYYALTIRQNVVMYRDPYMDWVEIQCNDHKELIDNLYDMIVKLKEEGSDMKVTNEQRVSFEIHKGLTEYAQSRQHNLPALPTNWVVLEVTKENKFETFLLFDTKEQRVLKELGGLDSAGCTLDALKFAMGTEK